MHLWDWYFHTWQQFIMAFHTFMEMSVKKQWVSGRPIKPGGKDFVNLQTTILEQLECIYNIVGMSTTIVYNDRVEIKWGYVPAHGKIVY